MHRIPRLAWLFVLLSGPVFTPGGGHAQPYPVVTGTGAVFDVSRGREIAFTAYVPGAGFAGAAPVVLVSHGGQGSANGHTRLTHLGTEYATWGYVAIHLNHLPSGANLVHRLDRPADVSFVIDQLESGSLSPPPSFTGTLDLERIAHVGHSWGAYTAMAVSGGEFDQGSFRDPRIKAACPISPQGPGGFGAFDSGAYDNTWWPIEIPMFNLVGELEKNGPAGQFTTLGWRLIPYDRYPHFGDKYEVVLEDQDHGDMGNHGSPATEAYVAQNTRAFLDVYLRGDESGACDIGSHADVPKTFRRKASILPSPLDACGDPHAVPGTTPFAEAVAVLALLCAAITRLAREHEETLRSLVDPRALLRAGRDGRPKR